MIAMASDGRSASGARDAALLGLLYGCGLRRAELTALDLADYDQAAGALRIQGKGNRERLAYLAPGARAALEDWLVVPRRRTRPAVLAGAALGPPRRAAAHHAAGVLYVARRRGLGARIAAFSPRKSLSLEPVFHCECRRRGSTAAANLGIDVGEVTPPVSSCSRCSSGTSIACGLSRRVRAAASSIASGIPSSLRQISATAAIHRARATIASQLYNAKEPMTLFELQAWLGHRSPETTQHYARITPTTLAKAYRDAGYFARNVRTVEVLIDRCRSRTTHAWLCASLTRRRKTERIERLMAEADDRTREILERYGGLGPGRVRALRLPRIVRAS